MRSTAFRAPPLGSILRPGAAALVAAFVAAPAASASDGVLEIHRACIATGCFPGDAPGFPVEITESGSYLLTSDLQLPDENTTAIRSTADRVSIDLGGFAISGVTECTGTPTTCSPVGSGRGIELDPDAAAGSVRNGIVEGMGDAGIRSTNGLVEDVIVQSNGGVGITASGIVRSSRALRNGLAGILCSEAHVLDSEATRNGHAGIHALGAATLRGNRVFFNGSANDAPGIQGAHGSVMGNFVLGNRGPGLDGLPSLTYGDNVFRDNNDAAGGPTAANQVTQGVQLGPNLCQGVPCP